MEKTIIPTGLGFSSPETFVRSFQQNPVREISLHQNRSHSTEASVRASKARFTFSASPWLPAARRRCSTGSVGLDGCWVGRSPGLDFLKSGWMTRGFDKNARGLAIFLGGNFFLLYKYMYIYMYIFPCCQWWNIEKPPTVWWSNMIQFYDVPWLLNKRVPDVIGRLCKWICRNDFHHQEAFPT